MSIALQAEVDALKKRVAVLEEAVKLVYSLPLGAKSEAKLREITRETLHLPEKRKSA